MTFRRNQTVTFNGTDAREQAEQLIREEGADMVEVVYHRAGSSKVRLLREFILESVVTQRLRVQRQSEELCRA